jgi:hypothetical protein
MNTDRPRYPIARPGNGTDTRFTIALALDVAAVIDRHGYPPLSTGADLTRLQLALFNLIYQETR